MPRRKSRRKTAVKQKKTEKAVEETPSEPEIDKPIEHQTFEPKPQFSISDFPQVGELVVTTCTKISQHGAYFKIEGYEILGETAGFVHISELSRTWVRNIRKHIREGQRTVCRVMRINIQRQEVDLSIRRVNDSQRRETLQIHKQEQRAKGILKAIGERFNLSSDEIENQIITPLETKYGMLFPILEKARDEGSKILLDAGLTSEIADEIVNTVTKELERPSVTLSGKVSVSTNDPNGILIIKEAFTNAIKNTLKNKALKASVNVISAPEYRIQIDATDWKNAEDCWQTFQQSMEKSIKKRTKKVLTLAFNRE